MATVVCFDASTLINFLEADAIVLLARHFHRRALVASYVEDHELLITKDSGRAILGHDASRWIERIELRGAIDLRKAEDIQIALGTKLRHRGEAESIVICQNRRAIFATDDSSAGQVARSIGIRCATTLDILRLLVAKQHLALDDAIALASRMQAAGQNVDPDKL